jgi:hypothetical protein
MKMLNEKMYAQIVVKNPLLPEQLFVGTAIKK